jgi:SAM-dependent methyltransferase
MPEIPGSEATPNEEQRRYWNEQAGPRWVASGDVLDKQLVGLSDALLERAAAKPGERVLDVGCGTGTTALPLARAVGPTGSVTGLDISATMLAAARERARREASPELAKLDFIERDAQSGELGSECFDLVFSRFGVMFFADPAAAFRNLHRATAPDGRLCFLCWQSAAANPWASLPMQAIAPHVATGPAPAPSAPGPFAFGDSERVRAILVNAGYAEIRIEGLGADFPFPAGGVDAALDFLQRMGPCSAPLAQAEPAARLAALAALRRALEPHVAGERVTLRSATWLVTARIR